MRIYAVADIHGSQYRLNLVVQQIVDCKPDMVVVCGDITQFGPSEVATQFLNQLPVGTLAVHGNCDPVDTPQAIERSTAVNLHGKLIKKRGVTFVGMGGDAAAIRIDHSIMVGSRMQKVKDCVDGITVLVTHVPPYRTCDRVFIGHHAGSKSLRELIDMTHPRLVLSGHIHEDPGYMTVNETVVVNCSIGKRSEGAVIELDASITVRFIS
ncbi:MAG: metallophosphoesterase family protein [Candidatus Thermoplasmatota archaeon]|nr:metallophosphoesterase family protein [Candidatus Thermoplasmatota archaeon]MBU1940736.1 metallophosphoesterase family protein [Candidatus Thermoplasmatota archaeon]